MAQFISVKSKIDVIIDDPSDNIFVECAVDGKADYIITGDHHLLSLGNYKGIQIIKAKDFLIKEKFLNHET
ncbi:MAG: putative toxin-antitoxin system toxin component, PIN family [Bacteroidetes bacterium]|nr:putative toxin-antitoxin system toxin component, PIN family [Bacteroidota bacterium]